MFCLSEIFMNMHVLKEKISRLLQTTSTKKLEVVLRLKVAKWQSIFNELKLWLTSQKEKFRHSLIQKNIIALLSEIESFLTNEEYETVVADEKKFIARSKIPEKYYFEFANTIVHHSSLFSTLN